MFFESFVFLTGTGQHSRNTTRTTNYNKMKTVNLRSPNADTSAPVITPAEKLAQLKGQQVAAWQEMIKFPDPTTKEAKDARLSYFKIEGEIKAVETQIAKAENDAKIAEARNARLTLNQTQLDAYAALLAERGKKSPDAAKLTELETAFNTAKEVVDNELLAKYAASKPAKVTVSSENGQSNSSDKSGNKAAILELARAGKSHKEIEAEGFKRSTIWHAINDAKIAGETFPNA